VTPLAEELAELIRLEGPISVSRYMALCLGHPRHGYYIKQDPFGAGGDFTTAPEISQIFGELIGVWAASVWQAMGAPASLRLVELGPGRGTLMQDMLRAGRALPGFREAMSVHLVETSPALRERQAQVLSSAGIVPRWHERIEESLEGPAIVVANEFLDALPVDQFVRTANGWRERLIGLDGDGALAFGLASEDAALSFGSAGDRPDDAAPLGSVLEQPIAALEAVGSVARHLATEGGAALFVDYGAVRSGLGDTLQAMRRHAFVAVLDEPGEADLTVHVDFARMAQAALGGGAAVHGPATQRDFLVALGLPQRLEALSRRATPAQAETLVGGAARLVESGATGMGELFKVIGVAHPSLPLLPGFDLHRLPGHG